MCSYQSDFMLHRTWLCITIGDEVLNSSAYEEPAETLNAATKNAAAYREGPTKNARIAVEKNATPGGEVKCGGEITVNGIMGAKSRLSESPSHMDIPQVRRLLEPLRALHSIKSSYIDAPISERYREEIQNSLSRARPSIHDLFPILYLAYEEAMRTFRAGCFALAIHKLRGTLDIQYDLSHRYRGNSYTKLATGPFAGVWFQDASERMHYSLTENLARAYLKFPKDLHYVRAAASVAYGIHSVGWDPSPHEDAMAYYLDVEVWEALDQLGEHNDRLRSQALEDVIWLLSEALHHEPENLMLQQEMKTRQKEKATAKALE